MTFPLFPFPVKTGRKRGPEEPVIHVDGRVIPVRLRRHARARRFVLRFDQAACALALTLPPGASRDDALAFAERQGPWLRRRLAALPEPVPFAPGERIPLRGQMHEIRHAPGVRGVVRIDPAGRPDGPLIHVAGEADHLPRRLGDWLKGEARRDLAERVAHHAGRMGLNPRRIAVRDQTTRWGSCSSTGVLSFSWRLILAPGEVLDYVAAHEVAHLAEMNHGPRFWALVQQAVPEMEAKRRWLRRHGSGLHRYGRGRA